MFITGMENGNDMFDVDIKIICLSTFLKIQTNFSKYRPNTDQFLTFFWKGLYYRPKLFLQTTVSSLQPSQKSDSKYNFCEKDFSLFDPLNAKKLWFLAKKRPFKLNSDFNNQQILLIFGLVTAFINQKIL